MKTTCVVIILFFASLASAQPYDSAQKSSNEFIITTRFANPFFGYYDSYKLGYSLTYARRFNNKFLRLGLDINRGAKSYGYKTTNPSLTDSVLSLNIKEHSSSSLGLRVGYGVEVESGFRLGIDLLAGRFKETVYTRNDKYLIRNDSLMYDPLAYTAIPRVMAFKDYLYSYYIGISPTFQIVHSFNKYLFATGELAFDLNYIIFGKDYPYSTNSFVLNPSMAISVGYQF